MNLLNPGELFDSLPETYIIFITKNDVLGYIEIGYGIFSCEGDEAVLDDITDFLKRKGEKIW